MMGKADDMGETWGAGFAGDKFVKVTFPSLSSETGAVRFIVGTLPTLGVVGAPPDVGILPMNHD